MGWDEYPFVTGFYDIDVARSSRTSDCTRSSPSKDLGF